MNNTGISIIIIIANVLFSYKGLTNHQFFEGYLFDVGKILQQKDYKRLITSGFLHVSWTHLIFNMITLYLFSNLLEMYMGGLNFTLIYFASLIGGNLLSLFIHRHHESYTAVGASGAVSGIVFASIALFPGMDIRMFFIPISIPSWIYGLIYVLFSIYGIRSKRDNIGHEAHLGGAMIGMLTAILIEPSALAENLTTILIVSIPAIIFIYVIVNRPSVLMIDNLFYKKNHDHYSIDHKYNEARTNKQKEIDGILDKISRRGINSLSKTEKQKLDEYSRSI